MDRPNIEVLNQEIDCEGSEPSHYRMLVDRSYFKYITIDPAVYEVDDLCFTPILLEILPPFPTGDWNCGRIGRTLENRSPHFIETSRKTRPSIYPLWHSKSFDYLSFDFLERYQSNVYKVSSPHFDKPIVAKFARFDWEIGYYIAETLAYSWIDGHNIGPAFLGYLTEEGRVIGFVIENIHGRHATISDLSACEFIVRKLHGLGILHGDLNKHNFLISQGRAFLIDFETAKRSSDREAMEKESHELERQLLDDSGTGGNFLEEI